MLLTQLEQYKWLPSFTRCAIHLTIHRGPGTLNIGSWVRAYGLFLSSQNSNTFIISRAVPSMSWQNFKKSSITTSLWIGRYLSQCYRWRDNEVKEQAEDLVKSTLQVTDQVGFLVHWNSRADHSGLPPPLSLDMIIPNRGFCGLQC